VTAAPEAALSGPADSGPKHQTPPVPEVLKHNHPLPLEWTKQREILHYGRSATEQPAFSARAPARPVLATPEFKVDDGTRTELKGELTLRRILADFDAKISPVRARVFLERFLATPPFRIPPLRHRVRLPLRFDHDVSKSALLRPIWRSSRQRRMLQIPDSANLPRIVSAAITFGARTRYRVCYQTPVHRRERGPACQNLIGVSVQRVAASHRLACCFSTNGTNIGVLLA